MLAPRFANKIEVPGECSKLTYLLGSMKRSSIRLASKERGSNDDGSHRHEVGCTVISPVEVSRARWQKAPECSKPELRFFQRNYFVFVHKFNQISGENLKCSSHLVQG